MSSRAKSIEQTIGERIRARRTQMGLVQEQLAAALGISYQQIQKYESGASRITASRLLTLAERLEVPVTYFFAGLPGAMPAEDKGEESLALGRSRPVVELTRGFHQIRDDGVRLAITGLVRTIAERQG
jgi:transcriptional regulator with XRE-family HTH domain